MQLPYGVGPLKAASDGTNFLVISSTSSFNASGVPEQMFVGATVDRNSAVLTTTGEFSELLILNTNTLQPSQWGLAAMPNGYALVSSRYEGTKLTVSLIPITTLGVPGAPVPLFEPTFTPHQYALFANAAGRAMLLWSHNVSGAAIEQDVFAGEMFSAPGDFAARRTDSFRLGNGPFMQESIAAATARDGTALVTWRERSGATGRLALYATRVAPNGTILDADSIRITDATLDGTRAAVASDGRDFLVAWSQQDRIALRRIGSDGRFLDDTPAFIFTANATPSSPALAWNGSEYLLAFNNRENGATSATYTTQIALVSAAGGLLEQPHAINQPLSTAVGSDKVWTYSYAGAPLVASDGRDFLVVYTRQRNEPPPSSRVTYASAVTSVSAAGAVTAADVPIVLAAPKALFWTGTTYVALDNANLGYPHGDYGYYGVRINSQGLPLDGPPGGSPESSGPLLPGYYSDFGVQPLCDATGCYAAGTWAPAIGTLQLFVWRVTDANGTFDRSDPSLVAEMAAMRRGSSAVALPGSVGRLLYTRVATEPELLGVSRVFLRTAQPPRTRAVHH